MCIDLIICILFWGTKECVLFKYPVFGGIHAFKLVGFIWFLHNFEFVNRFQARVRLTSGSMDLSRYNLVSYVEAPKLVYQVNMRYYGSPVLIVHNSFTSFTFSFYIDDSNKRYKGYIDHSGGTLICIFYSEMQKCLPGLICSTLYIVRMHSFKQSECIQLLLLLLWEHVSLYYIGRSEILKANVNLVVI